MKAQVQLTVFQYETDKRYGGDARVSIPNQNINSVFSFEMVEPNSRTFAVTITKNGKQVVYHDGGAIKSQLDSYSGTQMAIFTLLFRLIVDGVKEAQRFYNGTTGKEPIREHVDEAIRMIGKEPVASLSFSREFTWKESDRDMFEFLCASLR